MIRYIFLFLLIFLTSYGKGLQIISNYPIPENNINEIYQKTKDIKLVIDFLKKTGDFEKISYKDGKLYLKRKLIVKKVKIKGNKSFWRREILAITGLMEGYPVDLGLLHNLYIRLKKFYMDNGFPFAQINLDAEVDEKGYIYINLEINEGGEKEIGDILIYSSTPMDKNLKEKLIKSMEIEKGDIFSLSSITTGIDELQEYLRSLNYYDAFANLISFRPSDKNKVDIIVSINLGTKYDIRFIGNKQFSDKDLEKLLTFRENGFNYYQVVNSTDNIEKFYRENGFLEAKVIPSYKEDFEKNQITVIFNIYEGDRYKVSNMQIETDTAEVKKSLSAYKNSLYNKRKFINLLNSLKDKFFQRGYLGVFFNIDEKVNPKNKTVDLLIRFIKGKKYILKDVHVEGVKVELNIDLPDRYNPYLLLDTLEKVKKKLKDEGYLDSEAFLDVSFREKDGKVYAEAFIKTKKGKRYKQGLTFLYGTWHLKISMLKHNLSKKLYYSKNEFDNELNFFYYASIFNSVNPFIYIDKKRKKVNKAYIFREDKRGSFQGTLGYNSEQKLKLSAAVTLKNLFKYGFEFSGYIEKNDRGLFYKLTAGNRLLPKRAGAFISYFKNYEYHSVFDIEKEGFDIKLERKPNKWITTIFDIENTDNRLKNQNFYLPKKFKTLKLIFSLIDDHKYPKTNPRKGYFFTGSITKEFQDIDFYKVYATGRYYMPFYFFIFTQKLSIGYIFKKTEKLPPSERFFMGGISSFRGFGYEDIAGKGGRGGNTLFSLNTDIRYPIFPSYNLYGFSFVDIGNIYEKFSDLKKEETRETAGTGVYIPTPVGSFLFDIAFKLDRKKGEDLYRLEFSINTLF